MSSEQIYTGLLQFAVLLFSLVFHEFSHAWTAMRNGDPTAKELGRVTLNPVAHADPVGTVLFPLMQIFTGVPLIGWAKPVPVSSNRLRHPRRDDILVSMAGPGSNLLLAFVAALLWRANSSLLGSYESGFLFTLHEFMQAVLPLLLQINVLLALFNLIPMPPLDGSWVLYRLLPPRLAEPYRRFGRQWGFIVVLALVFTGVARQFIGFGFSLVAPFLRAIAGI